MVEDGAKGWMLDDRRRGHAKLCDGARDETVGKDVY